MCPAVVAPIHTSGRLMNIKVLPIQENTRQLPPGAVAGTVTGRRSIHPCFCRGFRYGPRSPEPPRAALFASQPVEVGLDMPPATSRIAFDNMFVFAASMSRSPA